MIFRRQAQHASHELAQFRWVPFVARLLSDGPIRADALELTAKPSHLPQEALSAVQEIARRAVWRFLARECGWKSRRVRLANDDSAVIRLWQQPTPVLHFTEASIHLLVGAYNATREPPRGTPFFLPDRLAANGDFFLQFLVYRRLQEIPAALSQEARMSWARHPLIALHDYSRTAGMPLPDSGWNRLSDRDLAPFLPWLLAGSMHRWRAIDLTTATSDPTVQRPRFEIQHRLGTDWIRWADRASRPDWLTPLLEYFSRYASELNFRLTQWERQVASRSMRERQNLATPWARFLELGSALQRVRDAAHAEHPVDRSGAAKVYLSAWEELDFSQIAESLEEARHRLRPVLT